MKTCRGKSRGWPSFISKFARRAPEIENFMNATISSERRVVWLLCVAAAVHVFLYSAAFPVFNQLDEGCHFDLVVRYSQGQLPRGLQPMCREASLYLLTYRSPEFAGLPQDFPEGHFARPFWAQDSANQPELRAAAFEKAAADWQTARTLPFWTNYETSQPPLYYSLAGLWWRMGQWVGLGGLSLVYWLRFLNVGFVAVLVWIGHRAAEEVFPGQHFFTLGVPALIAFAPVQAFYSIQNDVLSPVCFGLAFIFLVRLWCAEIPSVALGAALGLSLAAAFLAKLSNLPLLAVSGIFIALKFFRLARKGTARRSLPALLALFLCAALPAAAWLAWMKIAFGDFTGSAAKLRFITWTLKPFREWWHHPIFTPYGIWTFSSQLAYTAWQDSIHWHANLLTLPGVDAIYSVLTLCLILFALLSLLTRATTATEFQRAILWFSFGCIAAGALFLAWLSIIYDFGICMDPSREHPYFAEGRLVLGALVPFLLLYLFGLNYLLRGVKNPGARFASLAAIILFMLISEIVTDWTVFSSEYNWYHLL
jgi:hypothetical protein